ncbi:hypothetical protein [uncultured Victivallis sp.]|uniref:hypothetical protein n=1 Tax=uncultured Victivallis sp. TaxID=354118 RepID=UPI0025E09D75|nr:hypothetical protein [uncultured Victivallis sp.]
MSNLESIVPPVAMCKLIPAGEFEDSALVWVEDEDGIELVMPREVAQYEHDEMIPAPTPEEIIIDIGKTHKNPVLAYCHTYWDTTCYTGRTRTEIFGMKPEQTASESALRLWFRVKGIEVE